MVLALSTRGITTNFTDSPLRSSLGQPGCVGIRTDLGGTPEEAACILKVLGEGYFIAESGCTVDGFRHMVVLR